MTNEALPRGFADETELNEFMSRPHPRLVTQLTQGNGDWVLPGIGGTMGVALGMLA